MTYPDYVNRAALQAFFQATGLDAIFATSPKNVFYYSGSPTALSAITSETWPYPLLDGAPLAVVTRDGSSQLLVGEQQMEASRERAWCPVGAYRTYHESPIDALISWFQRSGLSSAIVGYESDYLSAQAYLDIRAKLPSLRLVPCDSSLERIRSLKTDGEVTALKRGADLLDQAILDSFESAREGSTEWELHLVIVRRSLELGAQFCRGIFLVGESNDVLFRGTSDRKLKRGDIVHIDHAAYFDGYPANLSRHAVVGPPSDEQKRLYGILMDVERRVIDFMRPGRTGREVFFFCRELLAGYGLRHTAAIVGHNLGLGYHERPMLIETEEMPLEASNVIALEPIIPPTWEYHIQDEILIRDEGNVLLSDRFDTREMYIIQ